MTQPAPLAVVSAFLKAETALPDRHHGPKGRTSRLLSDLRSAGVVAPADAVLLAGVEWAFTGALLGIMSPDQGAAWLVADWLALP